MSDTAVMPAPRLSIGVTGHRENDPGFAENRAQIAAALAAICAFLDSCRARESATLGIAIPARLHTLLADGTDQLLAQIAAERGWEIIAPLPFGKRLNAAINSTAGDADDVRAVLAGARPRNPDSAARLDAIEGWYGRARLFELAERDDHIARLWLAALEEPGNSAAARTFVAATSQRASIAGRVMLEQSDILIAVWNGSVRELPGGTGHTIAKALAMGTPVLCIDTAAPADWRVLLTPEALYAAGSPGNRDETLAATVRAAVRPQEGGALRHGAETLQHEVWHRASNPLWTQYRRIETLFGGEGRPLRSLRQVYETPDEIATGSAAGMVEAVAALPGIDKSFADDLGRAILRRFAWSDGISTRLSDAYRGGMVANFVLSALAIAAGIAYQPLADERVKWVFALAEFLLLTGILAITWLGTRRRWHRRWFETRRVAEYLRHGMILSLLGTARPPGRWPKGIQTSWPEYYARATLREAGLPPLTVTAAYLRAALDTLLGRHVADQAVYHRTKARRLRTVHHRLDKLSTTLFLLAFLSVTGYLTIKGLSVVGWLDPDFPKSLSKIFTYMGVIFPTFGAAIAGIRYFGDFERFAAISEVSAGKLEIVHRRLQTLLADPAFEPEFANASDLAHAMDDIVVEEIENWQAVFGGKHIAVPV
jgi:hypothetical protein